MDLSKTGETRRIPGKERNENRNGFRGRALHTAPGLRLKMEGIGKQEK